MMGRWLFLLGGPLIWAAHFGAIYATASVSHVIAGATGGDTRSFIVVISMVCVGACAWLITSALRRPPADALGAFWRNVAAAGAVLAIIAITWQTLPALAPLDEQNIPANGESHATLLPLDPKNIVGAREAKRMISQL
jgi:hypothetical protein